jgi:hypothetical protein
MSMADHGEVEYATATGNDYAEHEATYAAFVKAAVVGTIFVVNIVVALAVGGVTDHWLATLGLVILAILAGVWGLAGSSNIPGVAVLVLGLLSLYGLS